MEIKIENTFLCGILLYHYRDCFGLLVAGWFAVGGTGAAAECSKTDFTC